MGPVCVAEFALLQRCWTLEEGRVGAEAGPGALRRC